MVVPPHCKGDDMQSIAEKTLRVLQPELSHAQHLVMAVIDTDASAAKKAIVVNEGEWLPQPQRLHYGPESDAARSHAHCQNMMAQARLFGA